MSMEHDPVKDVEAVKALVEAHLQAMGRNEKWLYDRMGMGKSSYYDMWRRGSTRLHVVAAIARAMGKSLPELLTAPAKGTGSTTVAEPSPRYGTHRYLEDRIADLERAVAALQSRKH